MNCLLLAATLCLFVVFATAQSGCNISGCTSQQQAYTGALASREKDRICSAGRTYRDCLGSSCPQAGPVTTALKLQGCGSGRVVISVSSLLMTLVFTKIFM
ncbi:uncharacterized protein LOC124144334 [Haliotis rufescens]|uniref:uncharacterized protein LOC124144334 n=1 Tax=Haliotis rufescens TaxID=6454 RepID=UPI00201F2A5C|nr:uncharacterized protein LOC124144334 [Haliotis rufescens]